MTAPLLPPAPRLQLGRLIDREAVWDVDHSPHLLICGDTGAGKTTTLLRIIQQVRAVGLEVCVCDGKGSRDFCESEVPVVTGVSEIVETLARLVETMQGRHRAMHRGEGLSDRLFLILDEWAACRLMPGPGEEKREHQARIASLDRSLTGLVTQGRSAGIHVVLGIQRPDAQLVGSGLIRDNFRARIALGNLSEDGHAMVFSGHRAPRLGQLVPGKGYGLGLNQDLVRPEPIRITPPEMVIQASAGKDGTALSRLSRPDAEKQGDSAS